MALTTTTTSLPRRRVRATWSATSRMRSGSATDVPPYFWTTSAIRSRLPATLARRAHRKTSAPARRAPVQAAGVAAGAEAPPEPAPHHRRRRPCRRRPADRLPAQPRWWRQVVGRLVLDDHRARRDHHDRGWIDHHNRG